MSSLTLSGGIVCDLAAGTVERRDLHVSGDRVGGEGGDSVDVSGCIVTGGFVCAHHHLYSALARGMPGPSDPPHNFREILERVWWRLDRALDPEAVSLSARLGALEAALAGTTTIVDHHASPEAIDGSLNLVADGISGAGLRGAVCYEVTDRHGEKRGRAGIAENLRFIESNDRALIAGMVGAHASFTIGDRTMEELVACARNLGAPLHIHVAEDAFDEDDSMERYGLRTAERLASRGALAEGDLIAHGVHLDDSEINAVRASGAFVAHNPRSNMNNGVGYAPALRLGERVALGTDGIDGDMLAETKACYLKAREASWSAGVGFAVDRLAQGHSVAGSLFGEPALGRLSAGAPADLVVLEYEAPTPVDETNLGGHLIFGRPTVRDVMVAGRWVVRSGKHVDIDEQELRAECSRAAPRLWKRMEEF
ncbi:MAG: amidohydrolase family protein [Actinomycetota bacterium]